MYDIFPALFDASYVIDTRDEETWHDLPDPRREWTGRISPVFIDENPDDEWEF